MQLEVNGEQFEVDDEQQTLLEVLRDQLRLVSVKDGCSPQGQCGCCTVLVDGEPRVSCVTPARRVADRSVTTLEGLEPEVRGAWAEAFCSTGASQCGFCTPGIVMRLEGLRRRSADPAEVLADPDVVNRSLAAHLCRCTGWQTILEAAACFGEASPERDLAAASRRATIEGRAPQIVGPEVALGAGGFADDLAPNGSLVAVRTASPVEGGEEWSVAPTLSGARVAAGKVQGRRSTVDPRAPIDLPEGEWAVTLQTGWVDPAYLETDSTWSAPGTEPATILANGGAFGGKSSIGGAGVDVAGAARDLAAGHGTAVRVRLSREDVVRLTPKRPPMAIGLRDDGSGVVRVARTSGIAERIAAVAPGLVVEEVEIAGPPTSAELRAAGWAEVAAVLAARSAAEDGTVEVTSPEGAVASVRIDATGAHVRVSCGLPLDEIVLRSYCIGAVHMALGWVCSEGLVVDEDGDVASLTIRSLGIVRPGEMIPVEVEIVATDSEPVCGSDAVFAAAAAAVWVRQGCPPMWPTGLLAETFAG